MQIKKIYIFIFSLLLLSNFLCAETIDEKKERLRNQIHESHEEPHSDLLRECWQEIEQIKNSIKQIQNEFNDYPLPNNNPQDFQATIKEMNQLRQKLRLKQEKWSYLAGQSTDEELHAIWHQPQTTLIDLITDFGSSFIYIVPDEIAQTPLSISSNLPVPSTSWDETLEFILSTAGFGVKQLSPFVKSIFYLIDEQLNLSAIVTQEEELQLLKEQARVCFILSLKPSEQFISYQFFLRFSNPVRTKVCLMGKEIFIIGTTSDVKELFAMYKLMDIASEQKECKLITLQKMNPTEMANILKAFFSKEKENSSLNCDDCPPLQLEILPVENQLMALFLVGSSEDIKQAEDLILQIEATAQDPKEKVIFYYTCKHSQPEELAKILEQVYKIMVNEPASLESHNTSNTQKVKDSVVPTPKLPVEAKHITASKKEDLKKSTTQSANFVVDAKCGSIVMVVEKEHLNNLKDLITKLDVPKKMVRIEVLLFEKRVTNEDHFGLNLLKVGSSASQKNQTALNWQDSNSNGANCGILSFFLSSTKNHGIPSFDIAYNFLMSQQDVQINSCPSVTTLNQTPAKISLVEEISLNNGTYVLDDKSTNALKDSYSRAQYGITIEITPTIHQDNTFLLNPERFITLETDIVFDTTKPSKVDRPEVIRRNIKNQVRVKDGQTVILGGLRRKTTQDDKDSIPFFGEIPGLSQFFSETRLSNSQTEMFIFLTPKIVDDSEEGLKNLINTELCKRPGDIPEFLECMNESKKCEWKKLFSKTLDMIMHN
jgi:general secretion pathway protein D